MSSLQAQTRNLSVMAFGRRAGMSESVNGVELVCVLLRQFTYALVSMNALAEIVHPKK